MAHRGDEVGWRLTRWDVTETPWPLEDESVQCIVTSPPYWGLRDYGVAGQLGLERTPGEYVERMVAVFREARRVLREDGTLWLNLGDCYATGAGRAFSPGGGEQGERFRAMGGQVPDTKNPNAGVPTFQPNRMPQDGLKPKDLVGIPWRVAFALQADGWWLRSDIVWAKPNPMPESITDRPTRAHEYVFLLTKSRRYYYDQQAIRQRLADASVYRMAQPTFESQTGGPKDPLNGNRSQRKALENMRHNLAKQTSQDSANRVWTDPAAMARIAANGANARTVWSIATEPYPEAHFATFPQELARRCILAGSAAGDLVLDPFAGSGTTLLVADTLGRRAVGLELSPEYVALAERRLRAPRTEEGIIKAAMEDEGQVRIEW